MTASATRVSTPEEIAARQLSEAAQILFPDIGSLFRERSVRLRQLAAAHPMRDFLIFMADVSQAQHEVLQSPFAGDALVPSQEALGDAARNGVAPLAPDLYRRDPAWQMGLQQLVGTLKERHASAPVADVLAQLQAMSTEEIDRQADRLLAGIQLGLDMACAPLIGAALQVYWSRAVNATQSQHPDLAFGRVDKATLCPCCGSRPVASILRLGIHDTATRYLHCALCQSQWHMVRIQCTHCESPRKVFYQELEEETPSNGIASVLQPKGAVRAECCDDCGHYLKIVSMEKDSYVDPVADDLASVSLDLLVSETGMQRHGLNFMLLFGQPEEETADGTQGSS